MKAGTISRCNGLAGKNPGKVQITKKNDGTDAIKGEQRNVDSAEFVTIDGTLKVLSPRELFL